jgi:SWI/SNF-related matrix-associated actin-dependent regulator of chromatin subfamily A member 5
MMLYFSPHVAYLRFEVNDDIEAIIAKGEERTAELNNKWEGLNFEDLSNFKSEANIQTWEGEDYQNKV